MYIMDTQKLQMFTYVVQRLILFSVYSLFVVFRYFLSYVVETRNSNLVLKH
jgi:hypothetical protein